jgi:hypothetical protein
MAKVSQRDIIRLGSEAAALKGGMKLKDWRKFKQYAAKRGFTLRSAASDAPDALKERTRASLLSEAKRTVADAYRPAVTELSTRERAIQHLDQARAASEAGFNQWLAGETAKLEAQGRAADTALATQQAGIAKDNDTALQAAQADSLARMRAQSSGSDPSQSAALQGTAAADEASRARIANSRMFSGDLQKVAETTRQGAKSSALAAAAAAAVSRRAETTKALGELTADRTKLSESRRADATELAQSLRERNIQVAQSGREFSLAATELGYKRQDLAEQVRQANREFRLDKKKFDLDVWEAKNEKLADQAKIQLDYDRIAATDGQKAADRALREWVERYKARKRGEENAKDRAADGKKGGITSDERDLFRDVQTVKGLLTRWRHNGAVPPAEQRQKLREMGFDDTLIDVAKDWRGGDLSPGGRALARRLGIKHVGYFFGDSSSTSVRPQTGTPAG